MLRVPLLANGHIDGETHARNPEKSTVRRFWPREANRLGYVTRNAARWQLISAQLKDIDELIAWFEDCAFIVGAQVSLSEPHRGTMPFLVADIRVD
ncbi:MAG: hypothetical protein QNI87_03505 [Erythrobacter sp.]|uniref:hypothetical protein n=1 Tax=Erythrobacter sp. TaxID=1042 RepID=UPI002636FB65|nr:hypothetical protein [Erythrobacter sp.]MDJ0977579.1 hypothetical protein [Erythrobacter sp.]